LRIWRVVETAGIALALVVVLFPIYWNVQMSLKWELSQFSLPPKYLFTPSLVNYRELLKSDFMAAFWNSTVVAIITTVVSLMVGVPAAYGFSRLRSRHISARLNFLILSVRMAPPIVFALPLFLIFPRCTSSTQSLG
jgi:multiple sugar transport system permease protein